MISYTRAVRYLVLLGVLLASSAAYAQPAVPTFTDTRCAAPPTVKKAGFRHKRSKLIAKLGSSNHRGIDLIATEDDAQQHHRRQARLRQARQGRRGRRRRGLRVHRQRVADRSAVCRTDDDGRFELDPRATLGYPIGMRDLYVAALGDGSGAYFVGYVAPRGTKIVVTDVDGTISWSENSIIKTVIKRAITTSSTRPNAPQALAAAAVSDRLHDRARRRAHRHHAQVARAARLPARHVAAVERACSRSRASSAIMYKTVDAEGAHGADRGRHRQSQERHHRVHEHRARRQADPHPLARVREGSAARTSTTARRSGSPTIFELPKLSSP